MKVALISPQIVLFTETKGEDYTTNHILNMIENDFLLSAKQLYEKQAALPIRVMTTDRKGYVCHDIQ